MDFSQFVSDLLATVVGAGLAIWSAIWLERRSLRGEETRQSKDRRNKSQKVLTLISYELNENLTALKIIDDNISSTFRSLRTESWKAFSDGGELQSIDNPDLLATISTAYATIRQFSALYDKYFDMTFFPDKNAYVLLAPVLLSHTIKLKIDAIDAVTKACAKINATLPPKKTEAVA